MKSIKVADEVHEALQDLQRPRESLSEVIKRLLAIYRDVHDLVKKA